MSILARLGRRLAGACVAPICAFGGCRAAPPSATASSYDVTLVRGGEELALAAEFPAGGEQELTVAAAARPFVHEVNAEIDGSVVDLALDGGSWRLPAATRSRRVSWRFAAADAARAIDDVDLAAARGQGFVGSLAAFLFRVDTGGEAPAGASYRLRAHVAPGENFTCACTRSRDEWIGRPEELGALPACAFGRISVSTHSVDGLTIELAELEARDEASAAVRIDWLQGSARAVVDCFGRAPIDQLLVIVSPDPSPRRRRGGGAGGARTRGGGGASIYVSLRRDATKAELDRDWVLIHELIHVCFPSLAAPHHWLEEGLSIYLEPLLRARQGRVTEPETWRSMVADFPQGLPGADDPGLDHVRSWARTYYGGAIWWLTADVEIRARTRNAKSLQDALRAIAAAGGNVTQMWPVEELLELGDRATGTTVMAELYAKWKDAPEPRELDSLWRQLGVRLDARSVSVDDAAPLAFVRRELVLGGR